MFFFHGTPPTEIYSLSLHDALPIFTGMAGDLLIPATSSFWLGAFSGLCEIIAVGIFHRPENRSEEHTSELQSQSKLVCRLLLEKKKNSKHQKFISSIFYFLLIRYRS